jgi:hypothetical protein
VYRLTQLGTVYISFILATCFGPFLGHRQAYVSLYNCTFSLILLLATTKKMYSCIMKHMPDDGQEMGRNMLLE